MNLYHPGKVLAVFSDSDKDIISSDENTQATVEMWDENVFTFRVDTKIAKKIKEDDVVLVDYRPISEKCPIPRNLIVKILKGKRGERVLEIYKKNWEKHKKIQATKPEQIVKPSYVG